MSKIDIINDCGDCSNSEYRGNYWICSITGELAEEYGIPASCPLPGFTEPGVEADGLTQCRCNCHNTYKFRRDCCDRADEPPAP